MKENICPELKVLSCIKENNKYLIEIESNINTETDLFTKGGGNPFNLQYISMNINLQDLGENKIKINADFSKSFHYAKSHGQIHDRLNNCFFVKKEAIIHKMNHLSDGEKNIKFINRLKEENKGYTDLIENKWNEILSYEKRKKKSELLQKLKQISDELYNLD